jgi:outer membrane protein assembly factor BamD
MFRKALIALLITIAAITSGCHNNKAPNPIANLDSKQPDKVLFDRSMEFIRTNKFDQARITLQTLINTYPDSEYIARAKLAVGDSWYAEGGTAALQQAEVEYKDFQTFFPNMPEAAEAQLKVAGIHYKQMEKPDRDYTQAKRAEDEYRNLIQQYPDSKLVPEAKQRLRDVQEVLAEREYRIGHFYYQRESYAAAIARLKSLIDQYPLYSGADDALFLLGETYQQQADRIRAAPGASEVAKANLVRKFEDQAAQMYSRIIERYPAGGRHDDAVARLQALHRTVPTPTPEALAQSKTEEASRGETTRFQSIMGNFKKGPDIAHAAKVGEPSLQDAKQTNATDVVKSVIDMATDTSKATVETVKPDAKANQPVPRSDSGTASRQQAAPDTNTPAPAPPPNQVNDAKSDSTTAAPETDSSNASTDKKADSTSKPKKKKGLRKIIPF